MKFNQEVYEEQWDQIVENWTQDLAKSKYPKFDRFIYLSAWNVQVESLINARHGRRLPNSFEEKFYVYALLDPRKPGEYQYEFYGKQLTLSHEPFYIGKGSRDRVQVHAQQARKNPKPKRGEHKLNVIRKLQRLGLEAIEHQLSSPTIECVAFAKEMLLIERIGRSGLKTGPLTNGTAGREGGSGVVFSEKRRQKVGDQFRGSKQSSEHIAKRTKARVGWSPSQETRDLWSAQRSGRKLSEEHRQAFIDGRRKQAKRRKALGLPDPNLGKRHSPEAIEKMRKAKTGKCFSEAHKQALRDAWERRKEKYGNNKHCARIP
jgi:hypothetical protein